MSRISLHRPRLCRTATRRPAHGMRLLLTPFPFPVLHPNTHNKRCPKAQRLGLRSDQSPYRPLQGRSPDKLRHALSRSCQVRAPLSGRNGFAPTGDAKEHGVMLLHRAIAPFLDSTVVTTGKLRSTNAGHGSSLSPLGVVEHFRWARLPQSEIFSCLVRVPSEVWGCDSTVVTTGMFRSKNGGHGSMLSPLGVLERFRWTRLPQSESFSRLVHILSEVWGCRRINVDVDRPRGRTPRIGTGVADYLRKPSGTFHHLAFFVIPAPRCGAAHPEATRRVERRVAHTRLSRLASHRRLPYAVIPALLPSIELEAEVGAEAPTSASVLLSPSPLKALRERGIKGERVPLWGRGYPLRHAKSPEIPSGVIQSNQLRVQSTFNQSSIKNPQLNKRPDPLPTCRTSRQLDSLNPRHYPSSTLAGLAAVAPPLRWRAPSQVSRLPQSQSAFIRVHQENRRTLYEARKI